MDLSVNDAKFILSQPKTLVAPLNWKDVPNRTHKNPLRKIECRVAIDEAIQRGIFFRIIAYPTYPETMTFQLEVEQLKSRSHIPLYRLDVCPRSSHSNIIDEKKELSGLFFTIGETHEHIITDNLNFEGDKILAQSDKFARKIDQPPSDFLSCVNYICAKINIVGGGDLPSPEDQGLLL